jgi:hypothetical protein
MNIFRFDDAYEVVYKLNKEAGGYVFYCTYISAAIKASDSDYKKRRKVLDKLLTTPLSLLPPVSE